MSGDSTWFLSDYHNHITWIFTDRVKIAFFDVQLKAEKPGLRLGIFRFEKICQKKNTVIFFQPSMTSIQRQH